jgi:large subunit ribosomal protein L5
MFRQVRRITTAIPRPTHTNRLAEHYEHVLRDDLMILGYARAQQATISTKRRPQRPKASSAQQPVLSHVTVHTMTRDVVTNKYNLLGIMHALQSITGVRPVPIYASKDAAPWKLRRGQVVGAKCTLSDAEDMYTFVDKLVHIVLPKMKDFTQPLSARVGDATGNVTLGFPAHTMGLFPEIEAVYDMYPKLYGFDVSFVTGRGWTNQDARQLLSGLGLPIRERRPRPAQQTVSEEEDDES